MGAMPGIGGNAGAAAGALTFTYIGKAIGGGTSINFGSLDAGTRQAGDLLLYCDWAWTSGAVPAAVTPSGFTNLINSADASTRGMVSAKISSGSEGSVSGVASGTARAKAGLVFRPSAPLIGFSLGGSAGQATGSSPNTQTITAGGASSAPVLAFGHMAAGNTIATSISPAMVAVAGYVAGGNDQDIYYLVQAVGADISYDMSNDPAANNLSQSGWLTFTY